MRIIDQSHEILHITLDPLWQMELAGRTCYKSEDKIGCTMPEYIEEDRDFCSGIGIGCDDTKCKYHSSQKFTKMLIDRGHHAMLEFGDITVRFITNRGVTHELVRHRLFSFAQESTRYVRYDGQMEFIRPVWCSDQVLGEYQDVHNINCVKNNEENLFCFHLFDVESTYLRLLKNYWRPEQAREILPNALKTEIVVKGNIRQWIHCLKLRTSTKAHPQIRHLMLAVLKDFQNQIPILFNNIST